MVKRTVVARVFDRLILTVPPDLIQVTIKTRHDADLLEVGGRIVACLTKDMNKTVKMDLKIKEIHEIRGENTD